MYTDHCYCSLIICLHTGSKTLINKYIAVTKFSWHEIRHESISQNHHLHLFNVLNRATLNHVFFVKILTSFAQLVTSMRRKYF